MEEQEVVKRGPRDGEGAQIVFPAHEIDPVFDTYSGVCLGEGGGGDAQQPDAAMGGGGGKACYVKKRSAAQTVPALFPGERERGFRASVPSGWPEHHFPGGRLHG